MALGTFSKFYYGYEITSDNKWFDFDEGGSELNAEIQTGIYSPEMLADEVETKLNALGAKTYTVTFNRTTRIFTIAASSGTYTIRIASGANTASGIYDILGFTGAVNLTGAISYDGDSATGSVYKTQFFLQDYVAPGNWKEKIQATKNETADGQNELIDFGTASYTEFDMMFITDLPMENKVIRNNPSGVSAVTAFLDHCIRLGPIEFMPDENTVATYYKITLESSSGGGKGGTGYKLTEEVGKDLPGFYKTGKLKWRVL